MLECMEIFKVAIAQSYESTTPSVEALNYADRIGNLEARKQNLVQDNLRKSRHRRHDRRLYAIGPSDL